MTAAERLARQLGRADIPVVAGDIPPTGEPVLVLRGDYAYDGGLLTALADADPGTVLIDGEGLPVAAHASAKMAADYIGCIEAQGPDVPPGAQPRTAAELGGTYNKTLRKRETPFLLAVRSGDVDAIERRIYAGSYKGVTDLVTKYLWPEPALHVTRLCARLRISPNAVTSLSLVFVLAAMALFWTGQFGWGLLCAWAMTFLDTVDGKLARVTLTSSPLGNIFDHGIDLIHPPFWYWAWAVGCAAVGLPLGDFTLVMSVIVGGYVFQRLQEGLFMTAFGMEIHIWRPFDSAFRLITARRNPNLLILTASAIAGRPDIGLLAVAWWTVLSIVVHMVQIGQAGLAKWRGDQLTSWLAR